MKCGEFDKRNEEFSLKFSSEAYFKRLLYGNDKNLSGSAQSGRDRVIFDVGAHQGESAEYFHGVFPEADIYSFEPGPPAAEKIIALNINNVKVHQVALSDFDGSAEFNLQDISHLSSLHKINRYSHHSLGYAENETHTPIMVEVMRGDTFCERYDIREIDLLKIDVQANEVSTIEGFSGIIHSVKTVFVEISMYDFYEKRSSIKNIETSLPNFDLYDIYEVSKNPKTLGTDWATLVYRNRAY